MRQLYFQCGSGISGDMTVAALLDLGADQGVLERALESLHVDGYHLHFGRAQKCGIDAFDFDVHLAEHEHAHSHGEHVHKNEGQNHSHTHDHGHFHSHEHKHDDLYSHSRNEKKHVHHHEHRNLKDIVGIIENSGITEGAKKLAIHIFKIVAEAESKAHGLPVDEVHFHEVGAVDSIVDIVATAVCLDNLNVAKVYCPYICEGQGTVRCQHGVMPVPVPAVVNIAATHSLDLKITDAQGEMVTPTGAAIIAGIRTNRELPERFKIVNTGLGAGKKDFPQANILRIFEIETENGMETEEVTVLQTNIDDQSPELLGYVMDKLFAAGALDVWFEPIFMKKNRPAVLLNVLCKPELTEALANVILKETTSIGVRYQQYRRIAMAREIINVETEYGTLQAKRCKLGDIEKCVPEYESAKKAAEEYGVPLEKVYRAIFAVIS